VKLLAAVLVLIVSLASGLFAFAARVQSLTPAPPAPDADGIVALTGGSAVRLKIATDLLEDGKGRRVLLSGVDRRVTRQELWSLTGAAKPLFDCCVDLGFSAADTIGNARETAEWARAMGYRSLVLVTADYHTPRAMLELRSALPEARITAYPVVTPDLDARAWRETSRGQSRMIGEYVKYLAALGRETAARMGLEPPGGKPAIEAAARPA
jgi:uncharacterized SAM-binding protein YcdF (DUF218 family)